MAESLEDKAIKNLKRMVKASQKEIATKTRKAIAEATRDEIKLKRSLDAIEKLYKIINAVFAAFIQSNIPKSYKAQLIRTQQIFNEIGRRALSTPRINIANELIIDSTVKMSSATRAGLDDVRKLFRTTQQAVIDDARISDLLAQGIMTNNTPDNLKNVLKSELYKSIVEDEKTITIKNRRYDAAKYAEMVARTRTREAQTNAIIETIKSFGEDLVRVSFHATECDVCSRFEGKVFSVSGTNPKHPPLTDRPPYHPNCLHVLTPEI